MAFLNNKKFVLATSLLILFIGFTLGYLFIMSKISEIEKQELKILGTKQGAKGKTILEALVDVEQVCSTIVKELPLRFGNYKNEEVKLLSKTEKLTKDYENRSKELAELKEKFLDTNDLQLKSDLGMEALNKIITLNETIGKIREVDKNRLENTYQYSNYLYKLIEYVLYAYGFEKLK